MKNISLNNKEIPQKMCVNEAYLIDYLEISLQISLRECLQFCWAVIDVNPLSAGIKPQSHVPTILI